MVNRIEHDTVFSGDVNITEGTFNPPANAWLTNAMISTTAAVVRSKLEQNTNVEFAIPMTDFRVHDAFQTVLPGTAAADDLALVGGTFGTNAPSIQAGDLKAAGATTRYGRVMFQLPAEYDDAGTIQVRIAAGMLTTVADNTCTVDVECYMSDEDNTVSADLCSTAAQDMNSLTFADLDFTITETSRATGDLFDMRIAIACNDAATGTAVTPCIAAVKLTADIRG